ncbi:FAD-binding monooxygenase-like protein 5 [Diaporthe amygdali]|uniref:FAD-binding monooxygenase-like protein 5 n=1 Tax=Phomopsis amygdali TaxID=1214568 RepID=UPI0022FED732|nr:FAD-binding monooxygenase-like protein 5 [Diaporthe amygdali]KAJ0108807.1 FAD-binding monooxygenase-like protein 5 [Diaporthe amygdali]
MHIVGADGNSLDQQWRECRGAQAYLGTFVHNFPNLAILFGPNTFPANNSALYACETQVAYAAKALFQPLLDNRASVIEVKESVENCTTNELHQRLQGIPSLAAARIGTLASSAGTRHNGLAWPLSIISPRSSLIGRLSLRKAEAVCGFSMP